MPILAQRYPVFQPAMRIIQSITSNYPATVTTTFAHQYRTGLIIRFNIPIGYGMTQLNSQISPITVISDTQFTVDIDTVPFDAFVYPGSFPEDRQYPTITVIGEVNETIYQPARNVLPYRAQ